MNNELDQQHTSVPPKGYVEVQETYTVVDLGIGSGFKFGIGFALGSLVVFLFGFVFFGALIASFVNGVAR